MMKLFILCLTMAIIIEILVTKVSTIHNNDRSWYVKQLKRLHGSHRPGHGPTATNPCEGQYENCVYLCKVNPTDTINTGACMNQKCVPADQLPQQCFVVVP